MYNLIYHVSYSIVILGQITVAVVKTRTRTNLGERCRGCLYLLFSATFADLEGGAV